MNKKQEKPPKGGSTGKPNPKPQPSKLERAMCLLAELTDPDRCNYDHDGNCQAHGWFGDDVCPHQRAKDLLNE